MLLVDTVQRVIIGDDELKMSIARSRPHSSWLSQMATLDDLRKAASGSSEMSNGSADASALRSADDIRKQLSLFNYTLETLTLLLVPMFTTK